MTAVLAAFIRYLITFIVFVCVAAAGVVCGKKLRISKNQKLEENEKKEEA